ncbi:hypothetical protein MMC10_004018 [Thelotrema lepadinum]|nr:hypothetical protein [Thelotrema lepadinum]
MTPLLRTSRLASLSKRAPFSSHIALPLARPLSTTPLRLYPRKDSQDRESINTDATEYSKSGSDDAAAQKDVAFEPGNTKPEEAMGKAEQEGNGNPLDASPANHDISKPRGDTEGGAESSARASGQERGYSGGSGGSRGSPKKGGKVS